MNTPSHHRHYDSLEQEAYLNLWRTYDRLKAIEEDLFNSYELSAQQYNALRLLRASEPDGMTVQGIGSRLISRAPDMTRMLDRLEQRGWISRTRRVDNRRVVDVHITELGTRLLDELMEPILQVHRRQLGHLSPEKLQALVNLLSEARQPLEDVNSSWAVSDSESVGHKNAQG